ncbi:MAG: RNA 2',3'-cyclic phosphodiesterase [Oscillibacter sp.]|nr:RNA 2',3'-cyclic phosphodiesterase [Oscillibacter sp.]
MRLFIAIRLSDEIRSGLAEVQSFLRNRGVSGNFTRPENLHLTLAFIGEYADPESVLDAMRGVPFAPFSVRLDGFGSFGDLYWCGIGGDNGLSAYVKRLRRALAENGIPFDRKKFSPHITLIRKASFDRNRGFPGLTVPDASMEAERVSLMRSDRAKSGMVYTEIGHVFG